VKLLDIEVLFLSFFLMLKYIPDIFNCVRLPDYVPDDLEELRATLCRNAQTFFTSLRISLKNETNISNQNYDGNNVVSSLMKNISISTSQQFRMLEHWSLSLNSLPKEKKLIIWETSGKHSSFQKFVGEYNMEHYINEWRNDIETHKQIIGDIYNSILKLYEIEVLKQEIYSPVYISQKLREMDDFSGGRNNQKLNNDNLSDFKKVYSAPIVNGSDEFNDSIQYVERSQSQEQKVNQSEVKQNPFRLFTNSENTRSAFTIVKKEFEKMVIREENEEENIKEYEMVNIEEEETNNQKSSKKIDIANLLC